MKGTVSAGSPFRGNEHFQRGLRRFWAGHYDSALRNFVRAQPDLSNSDGENACTSYIGLTQVMLGEVDGIKLCRRAAHFESYDGDVYYNLALAELGLGNRRRAVDAIRAGLVVDPAHTGLPKLRRRMGERREPVFSFLSRNHPVNRFLGRLTYRRRRRRR